MQSENDYGADILLLKDTFRVSNVDQVAFVGAGGKTNGIFRLAREQDQRVFISTTTHLGVEQANYADASFEITDPGAIYGIISSLTDELRVILFTGPANISGRFESLDHNALELLSGYCRTQGINLLIEADGSKFRPLKAPAEHEPPIPLWIDKVIVVAGMSGLWKPATDEYVHRHERFCKLAGIDGGALITPEGIAKVLKSEDGGLKNIPPTALKLALLNQVDDPDLVDAAERLATLITGTYDVTATSRLLSSDGKPVATPVLSRDEPLAGIVLAAGGSFRYGQNKLLLDWFGKPLIRHVVEIVLQAGLNQTIVVTGEDHRKIMTALKELPVAIIQNPEWISGQSTSVGTGIRSIRGYTGGAILFLGDQPGISTALIQRMIRERRTGFYPIISPEVNGLRTTPTLFDRDLYPNLSDLIGDQGGRQLFSVHPPHLFPWSEPGLARDIDNPQDYSDLRKLYG